jgi:beta-galactosidase/beta-glucuronidase
VSAPLPREVRARRLSLDGTWQVQLEPGTPFEPIIVPFTFEAALSGIGRGDEIHERLRYRRTFHLPHQWKGLHVLLRFAGVDWRAAVSVDGELVGSHTGGYGHFTFDLGPLDVLRVHELVVEVEDLAEGYQPRGKQRGSGGIWYTRATGIWRPVWLEAVPPAHISSFSLQGTAEGTLDWSVETTEPVEVELRVDGRAVEDIEAPQLWSPETPHVYPVALTTESGDRIESYVGFRSIGVDGDRIVLNGEPRRLKGVLDQAYWPDGVYTAPDDAALRADAEAAKAMGFDLARMHVKVADPRWYAWCDRIGLLVAQDIPSPLSLATREAQENFTAELEEIVVQLAGHPSVALWIPINEHWGEPPAKFQRGLVRLVRERDPTRLVIDASGWKQRGDTDLVDVHDYGDDLSGHRSEGKPLWLGECGGVSLTLDEGEDFAYRHVTSPDELVREYERLVTGIDQSVAGFVWTQLTDVEGELNGLHTRDRRPKAPPEAIRRINQSF